MYGGAAYACAKAGVEMLTRTFLEHIPLERWGTPDDMAAAALFLASDDAGYISGSNLLVDGGWETTGYPDRRRFADVLSP